MQEDAASLKQVLIVDDEPEVRRLVATMCAMEGYDVVGEAGNGIDAEMLFHRFHPPLVVLDYMMPFQDGEKTARALKRIDPKVKILAISAVIHELPPWADAFLDKVQIDSVCDALGNLYATSTG